MDHKREDRIPPTNKGHGSGQTTTRIYTVEEIHVGDMSEQWCNTGENWD